MTLTDQLLRDEGLRLKAYRDHLGYLTIGVGRLIDPRKGAKPPACLVMPNGVVDEACTLTKNEALGLLADDITKHSSALLKALPWVADMDEARRSVLINMSFQLGLGGLLKFKNTLAMIKSKRYTEASANMLLSLWARQTPERAKRLSIQMKTGEWQ